LTRFLNVQVEPFQKAEKKTKKTENQQMYFFGREHLFFFFPRCYFLSIYFYKRELRDIENIQGLFIFTSVRTFYFYSGMIEHQSNLKQVAF